jgi:diguanylate cyclase (GGDEF)-like protein/PAS domain S-box-containing protein
VTPSVRHRLGLASASDGDARTRKPLVMARASAALFAAEGLLVLVATLVGNGPHRGELPALALVACAFGVATAILLLYERMRPWGTHLIALSGSAAIGALIYTERALYGLLFVWLLFFLTFFLKRRQAALHLAAMVAMAGAALFASERAHAAAEAFTVVVGILVGTHFLVQILRGELARLVRERTAALEREREDRALLDVLFATAPFGIAQLDRDLRYVRVNETLAAINGLSPSDQVGHTLRDVLPELADRLEPLMLKVLETGEPLVGFENAVAARDGSGMHHYRSARYPLRSADGEIVGVGVIVDDVTSLREAQARAEQALADQAETSALLDAVLTNAPTAITVVDRELRYVRANRAVYELTGLTPHEVLGRTFAEVTPQLADQVVPRLEEVLATGRAQIGEEVVVPRPIGNGREHHLLVSRYPVRDAAGDVVGVASILTDVTELRGTRDALESALVRQRETGALLDALFADAPIGILLFDRDLRYVRVNGTYSSWTGLPPEAHVGLTVSDLDPVLGEQVEPVMREVLRTGRPLVGDEATRGDGRTFRASRYPVRDEHGEVVGVATILDDVTELKDAELRLQQALAAERNSAHFLDQLLDHAPLALTFVDRTMRYRLVNRVAAEVTGRSPQQMLGRRVDEVYPELADVIVPGIQRVLETGEPVIGQEVQDDDPVTGQLRAWLVSRYPLRGEDGEVLGVTSIRTEVTPMKALEEQLEQMLAQESSARVEVEQARFELAQIASTDALTGLANRRLFSEHLALALARTERHGTMMGVLYLDLDGFKAVNDTLGHEEGDKLLCEVADLLREGSRDTDLVARLGGDEFLVLIADLPVHEADVIVRGVANRLADRIAGIRPGVSTSLGVAFAPLDGSTERELLAAADAEMYANKRRRKRAA